MITIIRRRSCIQAFHRVASQHGYSTVNIQPQHAKASSSAGHQVELDVYEPTAASQDGQTGRRSVLIHFSRGPILRDHAADEATLATLQSHLPSSHIVSVPWDDDSPRRHPQQIYDAVAAFDWTVENLLPERAIKRHGRPGHVGRIATCGELYGGGLATMLALTECKIGQPGISAVAVNNPIVDWSDLSIPRTKAKRSKGESFDASPTLNDDLEHVRASLFENDKARLDAFASPILFFRSSGLATSTSSFEVPADRDEQRTLEALSAIARADSTVSDITSRGPRYSYQFPSRSLRLRLPAFHITSGMSQPLHRQSLELAKQLEMSFARQSKPSKQERDAQGHRWIYDHEHADDGLDEQPSAVVSNSKLFYSTQPGICLWDASAEGQAHLAETAQWLRHMLTDAL